MEGILTTFGIDGRLIVIQIFNFVLLAIALTYFLYTPILNLLKEREDKIKKGVEDAENAAKSLSEASAEKKDILTAAHKDAEDISLRAKTHAEEKGAEIIAKAEDKADDVIQTAESKGDEIKQQAQKESEAEIAKIAILAAEKIMRSETS